MLNKVWYLVHVEKPPVDIIQNIKKDIHDFLWNYRKIRVNKNTNTLPIEMEGLVIMNIETQCEAIQWSILAKPIKEKSQHETRTDLMLWHLDQYWKLKQGVSIFKKYIGNTDIAPILPTYRSSWSILTGNKTTAPKALAEIYSEPIFLNSKPDGANNPSMFLNKAPPA